MEQLAKGDKSVMFSTYSAFVAQAKVFGTAVGTGSSRLHFLLLQAKVSSLDTHLFVKA